MSGPARIIGINITSSIYTLLNAHVQNVVIVKSLTALQLTLLERIARVPVAAHARHRVPVDATLGVRAARTRARILALARNARQSRPAVRIDDALGPTVRRRSHIPGQALARRLIANNAALRVRSARRRHARIA